MIGMMPYYPAEEEDPNQSEWQLVVSFCCKGMIEGVILMLLLWLLIQVLFVSNLEDAAILLLSTSCPHCIPVRAKHLIVQLLHVSHKSTYYTCPVAHTLTKLSTVFELCRSEVYYFIAF
ncbi:synaptotagmin-5 isoform X1 [Scomber scombrus]|uniref:Synaptotagmin-5 isoform X1 n=1 Tax=Scomber scombrus TaxID=13677 RepID=A0AAV1NI45_SCOSC